MTMQAEPTQDVLARLRQWEADAERAGREATQARLDTWRARIEELRVRAHLAGLDARDQPSIVRLDARLESARDRLHELAREIDDVWTVLATAYESAVDEIAAGAGLVEARVAEGPRP
jgi:hypothetical protein